MPGLTDSAVADGALQLTNVSLPPSGMLLRTGQTTQYNSELDDGYYQIGLPRSYTVLTTGQYSGTSNVDLVHYTAGTISFAATTPGTINDAANGLAIFQTGDVIVITNSVSNDGVYTVSTGGVAATIRTTEATVLEGAAATISIAKREALSNNCVLDNVTGLMWARYNSATNAKMGTASNGKMPWTGQLYDIYQYAAAANAASLGGYTDWRVPNMFESISLMNMESPTCVPDAVAFPGWAADIYWTATTRNNVATNGVRINYLSGAIDYSVKSTVLFVALVRGGV